MVLLFSTVTEHLFLLVLSNIFFGFSSVTVVNKVTTSFFVFGWFSFSFDFIIYIFFSVVGRAESSPWPSSSIVADVVTPAGWQVPLDGISRRADRRQGHRTRSSMLRWVREKVSCFFYTTHTHTHRHDHCKVDGEIELKGVITIKGAK